MRTFPRRIAAAGVAVLSVCSVPRGIAQSAGGEEPRAASPQQTSEIRDDQLRRIGNGVTAPELVSRVGPKFSDEARAEKFSGTVIVGLVVDTNGVPQRVRVVRGIGHGLDEEALAAVRQYRFKPAMENGKPVPVRVNVEVNFRIKDKPSEQ
jgi:TonB family protein